MARLRLTLTADTSDLMGAIKEFRTLLGKGEGIPLHLKRRIRRLVSHGGIVNRSISCDAAGRVSFGPGHELLSILAVLRAIRRA